MILSKTCRLKFIGVSFRGSSDQIILESAKFRNEDSSWKLRISKIMSKMYFRWLYFSGQCTSLPCSSRLSCLPTMSGERIFSLHEFYIRSIIFFCRLVHSGTTTFESNRRIHSYNLGWRQNWREVMGYNWRMALVWPGAKWVKMSYYSHRFWWLTVCSLPGRSCLTTGLSGTHRTPGDWRHQKTDEIKRN